MHRLHSHLVLQALPFGLLGVAMATLAAVIYVRQRASRVAVYFSAILLFVAIWQVGFAGMFATSSPDHALLLAKMAMAALLFLPSAIYTFTTTALRVIGDRRPFIATIWATSLALFFLLLSGDSVVAGLYRYRWGFFPRPGTVGLIFFGFLIVVLLANIVEYVVSYARNRDRVRRRRIRDLIISFGIAYSAMIDAAPMFRVDMRPFSWVPLLLFVFYAWRSIRYHRLSSITAARAAREILETMADSLFVIDAEARIRVINDAARNLFGYEDADILGRSIESLEAPEFHGSIGHTLGELGLRGPVRDQERVFLDHQGRRIDVSISISPIFDEETEEGAVVIVRDIRERKRAEDEFRAFAQKLQQSNRELEDFAYVASHDLQEPLRKIQAFGDRLRSKYSSSLPPEAVDYLNRMQSAAGRMQSLINDLLTFSRVTTKAQPFRKVSLEEIAQEVAKDLEARVMEVGGRIVIGPLPTIDADPLQMRQLLQNLIGNGLKFHRKGVPPVVSVYGMILDEPGDSLCEVVVSDNGIGFEEKYADRIFTMFERLHGRGSYEGTGIGLAICRKIAQRHGGDIRATSEPGEGATFIATLPINHQEVEITVHD